MPEAPVVAPVEPTSVLSPAPVAPPATPEAKLFTATPPATPATPPVTPSVTPPVTPPAPSSTTPPVTPPATPPVVPTPPVAPTAPTDFELALPKDSLLSVEDLAATKAEAIKAGLTKEQADGLVQTKDEAVKSFAARQAELVKALPKQLADACPQDPVLKIGDYKTNIELAHRGFEAYADVDLRAWLNQTGFANHPLVVRHFMGLGKAMQDDTFHRGSTGAVPTPKSPESRLYGKTTPGADGRVHSEE